MSMMTLPGLELETEYPPQILPDDSPRVRLSDPLTSHLASDSISSDGRKDSQQHVWLDLLEHGRSSAWEVECRSGRWSGSRVRTALSELVEQGRVVSFSGTGVTPRGRKCNEFEAVAS